MTSVVILLGASFAALDVAMAQDAETLAKLNRVHERLTRPGVVVSVEYGQEVLDALHEMDVGPATVEEKHRPLVMRIEMYAALAVGDAGRAALMMPDLEAARDIRAALEPAYLIATAIGDARLGYDVLTKLRGLVDTDEKKVLAARRRGFYLVGTAAPAQTVAVDGGGSIALADRDGKVLLLDFWHMRQNRPDVLNAALAAICAKYAGEEGFEMLGINADSAARTEQARAFVRKAGYKWRQHYEGTSSKAPLTHQAFKFSRDAMQVIVDRDGVVRCVGDARDPIFQYTLRAAVAEARGEYTAQIPRARSGKTSEASRRAREQRRRAEDAKKPKPKELPSNPEAASLLRQARVFIKTRMISKAKEILREIVRKYPGTPEAKDAEDWLRRL